MYVRRLHIENLKLIRDLNLSFVRADGSSRMWTVLVGENGLGKTSILRAIALSGVGPERANQLADIASLPDRRRPRQVMTIEGDFEVTESTGDPQTATSRLWVPPGINLFRGDSWWTNPPLSDGQRGPLSEAQARSDPDPAWFLAGYGVERQLPQPLNARDTDDRLLSRLEPLFDRGPIVATGFAEQLERPLALAYGRLLREALVESGLLPRMTNLYLGGRGGVTKARTLVEANRFYMRLGGNSVAMPATWLSQGYQATIAWIADLVGHLLLANDRPMSLKDMRGLALVDELDLFVHPRWQVELIPRLKKTFPNVQFVVTTHSPMVLPGLQQDELIVLRQNQSGNIVANTAEESPKLLTASEIYDLYFDLDELYPAELGRALRTYTFLATVPQRSSDEERDLAEALRVLDSEGVEPPFPATPASQ